MHGCLSYSIIMHMLIMLIVHVIVALFSLAYVSFRCFRPTETGLKHSYILIVGTLLSGVGLTLLGDVNMLRACMSGMFYLCFVSFGILAAKHQIRS